MVMLSALSVNVYAGETTQSVIEKPSLRWSIIASIHVVLAIENGRAVMNGMVVANRGTESITVDAELVRINSNGTTTHIWSQSGIRTNADSWLWERVHHVARGHDYRLTLTATAVRDGVSETVSLGKTSRAH